MPKELKRKTGPPKIFVHTVDGRRVGLAADFEKANKKACEAMDEHVRKIFTKDWPQEERVNTCLEAFVHPEHHDGVAREFLTRAVERWDRGGSGRVFEIVFDEKKGVPVWVWKTKEPRNMLVAEDKYQAQFTGSAHVELHPDVAGALFDAEGDEPSDNSTKGFRKAIEKQMFDALSDSSVPADDRVHTFMKTFISENAQQNPTLQAKLKEAIARIDEEPGYQPFTLGYRNDMKALVWNPVRPLPEITRYLEFDDGSRVALPTEISLPLSDEYGSQKNALAGGKKAGSSEAANHMAKSVENGFRQWLAGGRMPLEQRVGICRDKFVHEAYRNSPALKVFKEAAERLDKNPGDKVFSIRFEPRTGNLRWKAK